MNGWQVCTVVFEQKLSWCLQNQQRRLGPVAGWEPARPAQLQHLQAVHRPEPCSQPGCPPAGRAGSSLSQPFPTEGFHNGELWSRPLLPGEPGTSAVCLQQAELWVNGCLQWTYQSFSKRLFFSPWVSQSWWVWVWPWEGQMQVLKQYSLENGIIFFFS